MTTTTDRPPRRRWSKDAIRGIAWATGAATFLASVVAIAAVPKPPAASGRSNDIESAERPVVERHVIRRIVVIAPPSASEPVTVVQPPTLASAPAPTTPTSGPNTSTGGS